MSDQSTVGYGPTVAEAMKPSRAYELVIELQTEIARIRADNFAFQAANQELRTTLSMMREHMYTLEDKIVSLRVRLGESQEE